METLVSSFEVIKYSFAKKEYSVDSICNLIKPIEKKVLLKCFGKEFYDYLLSNVNTFDDATIWNKKKVYSEGDHVIYCGCIFESKINSNNDDPSDSQNWFEPVKFNNLCLRELWECFLREIICQSIYAESIPFETIQGTAKGLITLDTDNTGVRSANVQSIRFVTERITSLVECAIEDMVKWIKEQHHEWECTKDEIDPLDRKGCDFSIIKFISDKCKECTIDTKGKRRIAWAY